MKKYILKNVRILVYLTNFNYIYIIKKTTMKIETLKSLSLESQIEYLESRSLLYRVVYIYDVIDSYNKLADVTDLLLAYKPILTALKSVNEDLKHDIILIPPRLSSSKNNKDFKRSRIERIMKHIDLKPFFRDERLKQLGL